MTQTNLEAEVEPEDRRLFRKLFLTQEEFVGKMLDTGAWDNDARLIEIARHRLSARTPATPLPDQQEGESGLVERLRSYRPANEWGDGVHHVICDEAAGRITTLSRRLAEAKAALEKIANPAFNCSPHQYGMAMQAVAEEALSALRQSGEEG